MVNYVNTCDINDVMRTEISRVFDQVTSHWQLIEVLGAVLRVQSSLQYAMCSFQGAVCSSMQGDE